jgi:hypothetical protein
MKQINVKTENGVVVVKKLPLKKYAELLQAIEELPKTLKSMQGMDTETIMQQIPLLVANALPDVIRIICIATDSKKETIEEMGLDEVVEIITAISEVNNYAKVFDSIKKLTAPQPIIKAV